VGHDKTKLVTTDKESNYITSEEEECAGKFRVQYVPISNMAELP
jgi:hypothetical protein